MAEESTTEMDAASGDDEIRASDIVFDCPHCSASLAVDYEGAGLSVNCAECGQVVEVPIPDKMDISDIGRNGEEQEGQILNLRKSLADSEGRIAALESEIRKLHYTFDLPEEARAKIMHQFGRVVAMIGQIEDAQRDIAEAVARIRAVAEEYLPD